MTGSDAGAGLTQLSATVGHGRWWTDEGEKMMNQKMKILIAYDGSSHAHAAIWRFTSGGTAARGRGRGRFRGRWVAPARFPSMNLSRPRSMGRCTLATVQPPLIFHLP